MSSSVIRQKSESQNEGNKKTKHAKFSKKRTCVYQGVRNELHLLKIFRSDIASFSDSRKNSRMVNIKSFKK